MDLTATLSATINLSQVFGLISLEIRETNGKVFLSETKKQKAQTKVKATVFGFLQLTMVLQAVVEVRTSSINFFRKFIKMLHIFAYSSYVGAIFFTSVTTGERMSNSLNVLNELSAWFLPQKETEVILKSNRRRLAFGVFIFLVTVIPVIVLDMYFIQLTPFKRFSYVHFGLTLAMETIFTQHFINIANVVAKSYGSLTRLEGKRFQKGDSWMFRRRMRNEAVVKDFLDVFSRSYSFALLLCVFWSHSMLLHFVMKPNIKLRVFLWLVFISYKMIGVVSACNAIYKEAFGLVAFEIRHQNGGKILVESPRRLAYCRTVFAAFCVLQGSVLGLTVVECLLGKATLLAKTIRLLHLFTFTVTMTAVHLTAITKARDICDTLNSVNRLSVLLPEKGKCRRALSLNSKLLLCAFVYFPTVFVGSVRTVFSYEDGEWYKVFRSAYFAFNTWLENLFHGQLFVIVNAFRAVVIGYNENFLRLPREGKRRAMEFLHKMKSNDMFLKNSFHAINSAYEYNILFGTSWYFMALIYFINKTNLRLNFVFWAFYIAFKMSTTLIICHRMNQEVEKTAHHLHELFIDVDDPSLKEEIEIFSLQLMHRKAEFNACGFFKLDFSLLHSMIATVSTYIIILMQLQGDSKLLQCVQGDKCANCTSNQFL